MPVKKDAVAHAILAEIWTIRFDLENAMAELRQALELDSHRVDTYAAIGAVYLAQGKAQEAEASYRKATEVGPKSLQAHLALGEFYFSQRRMPDAEAAVLTACTLDTHAVPPRLLLGRIYVATGRLTDAEHVYVNLKALSPDDPHAYPALGLFDFSPGQKQKAGGGVLIPRSLQAQGLRGSCVSDRNLD